MRKMRKESQFRRVARRPSTERRRRRKERRLTPKVVKKRVGMIPVKGPGARMLRLLLGTGTREKRQEKGTSAVWSSDLELLPPFFFCLRSSVSILLPSPTLTLKKGVILTMLSILHDHLYWFRGVLVG